MIHADTLQLAVRNLKEAVLRTILTTLGVAIGVASLAGMVSLGVGLQEQVVGRFLKSGMFQTITVYSAQPGLGMRGPGGAQRERPEKTAASDGQAGQAKPQVPLDDAALAKIAGIKKVVEVYPNIRVPVEVKYGKYSEFSVMAGVPLSVRDEGVFQKISHGTFFRNDTEDTCMLGMEFVRRLSTGDPKNLIGQELQLTYAVHSNGGLSDSSLPFAVLGLGKTEKRCRIIGIVEREPGPDFGGGLFSAIMIPLRKARELGAMDLSSPQAVIRQLTQKPSYMSAIVRVQKPQDTDDVEKQIKELGFSVFSINDALQNAKKAFIILDVFLGLIGSIALSVASLGIVNTMVMSILERTREIGIMKALGGEDSDIRAIFLVEASIIGFLGGVIGMVLGWISARVINFGANIYIRSQGGSPDNMFSFPWWLIAGGILFSITVSLISGSYPASRAARLDPIQALRHD